MAVIMSEKEARALRSSARVVRSILDGGVYHPEMKCSVDNLRNYLEDAADALKQSLAGMDPSSREKLVDLCSAIERHYSRYLPAPKPRAKPNV